MCIRDAVQRLNQGDLCFKNFTRFRGTRINVIFFVPYDKCGLQCARFYETDKRVTAMCAGL